MKKNQYLTIFISSFLFMSLEISIGRLVNIYFGSTVQIWSLVLSIFILFMALGNFIGAWLSKFNRKNTIPLIFFLFSVICLSIPWLTPFIYRSIHAYESFHMKVIIFLLLSGILPITLISTVPSLIFKKQKSSSYSPEILHGYFNGIGGLGSLVGINVTTFFFFTNVNIGFEKTFEILSLISCFVILLHVEVKNKFFIYALISIFVLFATKSMSLKKVTAHEGFDILEEFHTKDQSFYVIDSTDKTTRVLKTSPYIYPFSSGIYLKTDDYKSMLGYHVPLLKILEENKNNSPSVLILGAGVGIVTRDIKRILNQNSTVVSVDINDATFEISKKYFNPLNEDLGEWHIQDARVFLSKETRLFDFIMSDIFGADGNVVEHVVTEEFFSLLKSKLKPGGSLYQNFYSDNSSEDQKKFRMSVLYNTLKKEFSFVDIFHLGRVENKSNLFHENKLFIAHNLISNSSEFFAPISYLNKVNVDQDLISTEYYLQDWGFPYSTLSFSHR